ncbi:MAG: hypothetical protein IKA50_06625 [Clostridia bacterium]|nr:hypothetical protein [Clostridia bacterium]
MKKWLALLLAVLMLCALAGCGDDTETKQKDNGTTTTTTTTTTTAHTEQPMAPLTLVEDASPEVCYWYNDTAAVDTNETLVLRANTDLTKVQFVSLFPDAFVVDEVLYTLPVFEEFTFLCINTYISDTIPTRGVSCTDKEGKTYYYAFTYSGKDGSISLTELNITPLSEERLAEIETYLNAIENNGFVNDNIYSCPEEVSLFGALYDGAGIGVGSWEWTDEEVQDYIVAAEWEELYTSVLRFAKADVEALLQKRLGISIADLTKDVDMLYIEKYDAYYHAHSDTQYQPVEVLSGWLEGGEGGLYIIDYKIGWGDGKGRVVLKLTKDGYRFVSNIAIAE